jgi:hypothetical protein
VAAAAFVIPVIQRSDLVGTADTRINFSNTGPVDESLGTLQNYECKWVVGRIRCYCYILCCQPSVLQKIRISRHRDDSRFDFHKQKNILDQHFSPPDFLALVELYSSLKT